MKGKMGRPLKTVVMEERQGGGRGAGFYEGLKTNYILSVFPSLFFSLEFYAAFYYPNVKVRSSTSQSV